MKNRFLLTWLLLLIATATFAQVRPPYDGRVTKQVVWDRAVKVREYFMPPSGSKPTLPPYLPDSLKNGALYYVNDASGGYTVGYKRYDQPSGTWVDFGGGLSYSDPTPFNNYVLAINQDGNPTKIPLSYDNVPGLFRFQKPVEFFTTVTLDADPINSKDAVNLGYIQNNFYSKVQSDAAYQAKGTYVNSYNGRSGAVVPASGDYSFNQIGNTPTTLSGYGITDAFTKTQSDLRYQATGGTYVNTFNGRSGTVTPANGDYAFSQISNTPTTLAGYGITDVYTKTQSDGRYPTSGNYAASFNGRTGAVTPATGDYTFSQIATTPTTLAGYGITDAYTKAQSDVRYAGAGNYVNSFNGRTGAVTPAANDYTFAQLASKPTTLGGYGITDAVPSSRTVNGQALSSNISLTTDNVNEGSTNQYFTTARSRSSISATGSLAYNSITGAITYTQPTNVSAFSNDVGYYRSGDVASFNRVLIGNPVNDGVTPLQVNGAAKLMNNISLNTVSDSTASTQHIFNFNRTPITGSDMATNQSLGGFAFNGLSGGVMKPWGYIRVTAGSATYGDATIDIANYSGTPVMSFNMFNNNVQMPYLTASTVVMLDANKNLVSRGTTGTSTSTVVLSASPTLTGTPLAPTAAGTVANTQIATTAFVANNFVNLANAQTIAGAKTFTAQTIFTSTNALALQIQRTASGSGGSFAAFYPNGTALTSTAVWQIGATASNTFGIIYNGSQSAVNISTAGYVQLGGTADPTHTLTLPSVATGIAYYNTTDQATNYERVLSRWSSGGGTFLTDIQSGGTGSAAKTFQWATNAGRSSMQLTTSNVYHVAYAAGPGFATQRYNGTVAAPTAIVSGDQIGGFYNAGYNGSAMSSNLAALQFTANENWSTTAGGTSMQIQLTPNGSLTRQNVIALTTGLITLSARADYAADFSSIYNDRSLIDRGYATAAIAAVTRKPVNLTANITMALNSDYLNTSTSTQYSVAIPATSGFATDGSRIITVLAGKGSAGVKVTVPNTYAVQSNGGDTKTDGTGTITLTAGTKVQLIPYSAANTYWLQVLSGSVTIN